MTDIKVIRRNDARMFMDEAEQCRHYVTTSHLTFGTSRLLPGTRGGVDPGHQNGEEIFYVAKGKVICYFPRHDVYHELHEGDIVLIPPTEPHQLINAFSEETVISWSLAPPD